jgi:hypothetical protein
VKYARAALIACTLACSSSQKSAGRLGDDERGTIPNSREDRVLLTQFNEIGGVAVSQRHVFITTPFGLGIMDRQFQRWLPPVTVADGYPIERTTVVAADPNSDAVWVGAVGLVMIYRPSVDILTRINLPGLVEVIAFDRQGSNAYVRASNTWSRISFNGVATSISRSMLPADLVTSPTIEDVYREFPTLRGFERLLTRDARLESWPVTAGTRSPEKSEVWLGTWGNGLFQVDPVFQQSTARPFGLMDRGAGAIARGAGGVWIAGLGNGARQRGGVTFAGTRLDSWRWLVGPMTNPLVGTRATDLVMRQDALWVATDRGLARMSARNELDFRFWTMLNGLPSDRVLSVAAKHGGAWVGTTTGLVFVADTGRRTARRDVGATLASGSAIRALLLTGDTLWVGSDAGLLLLPPSGDKLVRAAAATTEQRLTRPIRALARGDSTVAIATESEIFLIDLPSGTLRPRLNLTPYGTVRDIRSIALDERTLWVGGTFGALSYRLADGVTRLVRPSGAYDAIEDIELTTDYVWLATADGVTRLRRLSDGSAY